MSLRGYQIDLLCKIRQALRTSRKVLVQAPCGAGKSVIFAELIREATESGKKVLFLVHRRELIFQADKHLAKHGIQSGVIMAGEQYAPGCQVQLGSIQTVIRRADRLDFSRFDMAIVDEAHRSSAASYHQVIEKLGDSHIIGFTATPIRQGGKPLGDVFDTMVCGPSVQSLVDQGYLSDVEYMVPSLPDLRGVAIEAGEYNAQALGEKIVPTLVGSVVEHYLKHGGKKGIIFSCNQQHSNWLKAEFCRRGIPAIVIDSFTPDEERAESDRHFREANKAVLINVGIVAEGYDVPDCDTMVLARPTYSLGLYLQQAGRGMRPAPNKKNLRVIDHGANVYRHGLIEDPRKWELTTSGDKAGKKEEQSERIRNMSRCPECGKILNSRKCPCGHEITHVDRARNVNELKNCGLVLLDKKALRSPPYPSDQIDRLRYIERAARKIARKSARKPSAGGWNQLVRQAANNGWLMGAVVHAYKGRYGSLPWEDAHELGIKLPKGGQWKLAAADWLRVAAA